MNKIKKKLIIFFFIVAVSGFSEENNNFLNSPQTPEIGLFQRQGEFQVGQYTGTLNISYPLFTLKEGDFELPITLSYGGNGVKVSDNSTWWVWIGIFCLAVAYLKSRLAVIMI